MSNFHVQSLRRPLLDAGFGISLGRVYATLVAWQQRYELRRHLLELDDRLLEDMGISRERARQEAARPCWRD